MTFIYPVNPICPVASCVEQDCSNANEAHSGYLQSGSPNVNVNALSAGRVGDPIVDGDPDICDSYAAEGSCNVFINGISAVRFGDCSTAELDGNGNVKYPNNPNCFPPRPNNEASDNVFINGMGSHRKTDGWTAHCCDVVVDSLSSSSSGTSDSSQSSSSSKSSSSSSSSTSNSSSSSSSSTSNSSSSSRSSDTSSGTSDTSSSESSDEDNPCYECEYCEGCAAEDEPDCPCPTTTCTPRQIKVVVSDVTLCTCFKLYDSVGAVLGTEDLVSLLNPPTINGSYILESTSACTWSYTFSVSPSPETVIHSSTGLDDCAGSDIGGGAPASNITLTLIRTGATTWAFQITDDIGNTYFGSNPGNAGEGATATATTTANQCTTIPDQDNEIATCSLNSNSLIACLSTSGTAVFTACPAELHRWRPCNAVDGSNDIYLSESVKADMTAEDPVIQLETGGLCYRLVEVDIYDQTATPGLGTPVEMTGCDDAGCEDPVACPLDPPATIQIEGWARLFLGSPLLNSACNGSNAIYSGTQLMFDGVLHYTTGLTGDCGWQQEQDATSPNFGYVWIETDLPYPPANPAWQWIWRVIWHVYWDISFNRWVMRIGLTTPANALVSGDAYLYKTTGSDPYGAYTYNAADSSIDDCASYTFPHSTINVIP